MSWMSGQVDGTGYDHAPERTVLGEDAARGTSYAAVRLLENASRDAEALVSEARAEADELVTSARAEAERLVSRARVEADERRAEADQQLARARSDSERQRREAEQREAAAEHRVNELVELERRHRERLVAHFESQLEALTGTSGAPLPASPAESA